MKTIVITLSIILSFTLLSLAQPTIVTDSAAYSTGESTAVLDVFSQGKGFLVPRLTLAQKNFISSPATGLLIYQTDGTTGFYYYDGAAWQRVGTGTYTLPSLTSGSILFSDGSTIIQDNSNFFWDNSNKRLGIGTASPSTSLSFGGNAARTIGLERNSTTTGSILNLQAGGAQSGGTNLAGGALYLKSGISTGTGTSHMYFQTPATGTTGTSDNSLTTKMTLWGNGSISMGTSTWVTNSTLYVSGSGNNNQQSLKSDATGGSNENRAIWGKSQATGPLTTENNYGIVGEIVKPASGTSSGASVGVWGIAEGSSGVNHGVSGVSRGNGTENVGVYGLSQTSTAKNYGMWGAAYGSGTINYAVFGWAVGATDNYSFFGQNGHVFIGNYYNSAGELQFQEPSGSGSNYSAFKAQAQSGDVTYTLPAADGSSGQILSTSGSGALSWVTAGSGSGDISSVGSMTVGDAFASSSADDDWLGLGASAGRIEFDDQTTDEVNILDANMGIGTSTPTGKLDVNGTFVQKAVTIVADDVTPDVSGGNIFITSANTGATVITDIDNPVAGQVIYIIGGSDVSSSTIADSGNFNLNSSWTASEDDVLILFVIADNNYIELGRVNN